MHNESLHPVALQSVDDEALVGPILANAVKRSGLTRREIAARTGIHKDALRRILSGDRDPTLTEVSRILAASKASIVSTVMLAVSGDHRRVEAWMDQPAAKFLDDFLSELPSSLERVLGGRLADIRPRWGKATAQRVARLLSDHIEEIERRDAILGGEVGVAHERAKSTGASLIGPSA